MSLSIQDRKTKNIISHFCKRTILYTIYIMSVELKNNALQKLLVKLKTPKQGLETGKPYFLQVEDASAFPDGDRRVTICTDDMRFHEYYYPRDGVKFNEEFEIMCNSQLGGKRKTHRNRKNNKSRNNRRKSNRRR